MKRILSLLLSAAMLISLAACGGSSEPAAPTAAPVVTEAPKPVATEVPAPAEPQETAVKQPVITGAEECTRMLSTLGYKELNTDIYAKDIEESTGVTGAAVTPVSMEVTDYGFKMEVATVEYFYIAEELRETDGWVVYGTKADSLKVIPDLESQGYELAYDMPLTDGAADNMYHMTDYAYCTRDEQGNTESMAYVTAAYYPQSGNLYNVVQMFYEEPEEYSTAMIFADNAGELSMVTEVETVQWGEFTFELQPFVIQCGSQVFTYKYRQGMSLSDWACSELNTDGWIPWYDDTVLSPDRKYIAGTGYLAMENLYDDPIMTMYADEFDGELDHTYLYSVDTVSSDVSYDEAMAYLKTDEAEIQAEGNINVPVAHMVNARTPLFTPGFRTVGRDEGRAAYHSVELDSGLFLLDDIIDIYMNEIDDALIPHIRLYAFPESEEFMKTLEGKLILNAHPTPFDKDSEMLKIPEDAVCLTFERVPDGEEAPGSPNPRKPGHENLNHNAVYARYVTKDDPNFGPGVNLVFAVTFDDQLVYWLHMGSNFGENNDDVQWYVNAMGY